MSLSNKNAHTLLLDLNRCVEEYAELSVKDVIDNRSYDRLTYPPNGGFTDQEIAELNKLDNNEHLKNALRKLLADNAASVVFDMLNLLDGTSTPLLQPGNWTGVKLVDEEHTGEEEFAGMLHDSFYELYWQWVEHRGQKEWKLDNYEV